jgi:uncharacterized protein (TIGR00369 family)
MELPKIPQGKLLQFIKDNFEGKLVKDSLSNTGNWLGFTLQKIERGYAEITIPIKKEMTNPYGNIHGGMMACVIDEIIGWAVVSLDTNNHYTSLNLNVDFLYAIHQGATMRAVANVLREGKKIIHVECTVYDLQNTLLAKASSNLIVTNMQPAEGDFKVAN